MMHLLTLIAIVFYGGHVSAQEQDCCDLKNITCQTDYIVNLALTYGATGYSEIGIGSIEPTILDPATQLVMDIFNLTLHEGECLNIINTCRILNFDMDMENMRRIVEVNCARIVIQGRYTLETNPYFYKVLGNVTGSGNGSIILEDWYFSFNNSFSFVERNNSIYLQVNEDDGIYKTSVNTNATFKADSIKSGDKDITEQVLCFLNKFWKAVLDTFGKVLYELARQNYFEVYRKYFSHVPATEMYCNDLKQYVKKDCCL